MPSQPVFALSPECCVLSEEATNPRSTALEASTLTVTPQMRLSFLDIYIIILYTYILYITYYIYILYTFPVFEEIETESEFQTKYQQE
jgi:Ca2+/Na+ antiporter